MHDEIASCDSGLITVDCSRITWLDAHFASPLLVIFKHAQKNGKEIQLLGLAPKVKMILAKNGFLQRSHNDINHTTIPSTEFELSEEVRFAKYTRQHLARREMPNMTVSLQRKFFEGIDELFANCALHSESKTKVCACGQYFPSKKKLTLAITDGGHGILGSYEKWAGHSIAASDAIDWAMQIDSTSRMGDIPGGLGLNILREFIIANAGKLLVVSGRGYWCQNGSTVEKHEMRYEYPGTSVILEIDTSDRKHYDLAAKINPDTIW